MKRLGYLLKCTVLALVLAPLTSCTSEYSAKAIEAWVVDGQTGAPVEGVNVVAHWQLSYGLEGGGEYQLKILETVTDAKGRFTFPAWGPIPVPARLPSEARLKEQDPEVFLFKPGYDLDYRTAKYDSRSIGSFGFAGPPLRDWYANGDKLAITRIEKLSPQARAYMRVQDLSPAEIQASLMSFLDSKLERIASNPICGWREMPRMIASVEGVRRALLKENEAAVKKEFRGHTTLYESLIASDSRTETLCASSPKAVLEPLVSKGVRV